MAGNNKIKLGKEQWLRERLRRARREAEGYLELGLPAHALRSLERYQPLVQCDARGCYLQGEALREMRHFREALAPLHRSLELIPDDIHVWMALAWCYKRVGHVEDAIDALERAVDVEPGNAILHYNLACYWSLAHNPRMALRYLANALDIDGNFRDFVHDEPDFDPLRHDPLFQSMTMMG